LNTVIRDLVEVVVFLLLTFLLYLFFTFLLPIFPQPHGLVAMSELSAFSKGGLVRSYLFMTAGACGLLGALLMSWAPILTYQLTANLWITTFFFLWVDCIYALSAESHSYKFLLAFVTGLAFLYLFFFLLGYLGFKGGVSSAQVPWKVQAIQFWLWGWVGFYLGLSGLMTYNAFKSPGLQMPLALGALLLCFLNHLLALFLRKHSGKDVSAISLYGRWVFCAGFLLLVLAWGVQKWFLT
jgi:hypothetical protein